MELEKQVCTLLQAKKLKELGVGQESYFYHFTNAEEGYRAIPKDVLTEWHDEQNIRNYDGRYSAFTVAELGELIDWTPVSLLAPYNGNTWVLSTNDYDVVGDNEAQVRADMLIWLLENNHVSLTK